MSTTKKRYLESIINICRTNKKYNIQTKLIIFVSKSYHIYVPIWTHSLTALSAHNASPWSNSYELPLLRQEYNHISSSSVGKLWKAISLCNSSGTVTGLDSTTSNGKCRAIALAVKTSNDSGELKCLPESKRNNTFGRWKRKG